MKGFLERVQNSVFIIAEIGNNHNGKVETAKELIDIAAAANVDAVKFQTFRGLDIVTPYVKSDEYKGWDPKGFKYWYEFLDSIALPLEDHKEVFEYAKFKNVIPFSTPESIAMVEFLEDLQVPLYKVASMDLNNIQLLNRIARTGKPVIISTGMGSENDIDKAINIFANNEIVITHCISDYPMDYSNANLLAIPYIREKYKVTVGFSDHSLGSELAIASVALGARVIEKHITYSRNATDKAEHHFSLEPAELKSLVKSIRNVEKGLGSYSLVRSKSELVNKYKYRRSLHINKDLAAGEMLKEDDIVVLRPGNGAAPDDYNIYLHKKLKIAKRAWDTLNKNDIE